MNLHRFLYFKNDSFKVVFKASFRNKMKICDHLFFRINGTGIEYQLLRNYSDCNIGTNSISNVNLWQE